MECTSLVFFEFLLIFSLWPFGHFFQYCFCCKKWQPDTYLLPSLCTYIWRVGWTLPYDTSQVKQLLAPLVACSASTDLLSGHCRGCRLTLMKTILKVKELLLVFLPKSSLDVRFFWLQCYNACLCFLFSVQGQILYSCIFIYFWYKDLWITSYFSAFICYTR